MRSSRRRAGCPVNQAPDLRGGLPRRRRPAPTIRRSRRPSAAWELAPRPGVHGRPPPRLGTCRPEHDPSRSFTNTRSPSTSWMRAARPGVNPPLWGCAEVMGPRRAVSPSLRSMGSCSQHGRTAVPFKDMGSSLLVSYVNGWWFRRRVGWWPQSQRPGLVKLANLGLTGPSASEGRVQALELVEGVLGLGVAHFGQGADTGDRGGVGDLIGGMGGTESGQVDGAVPVGGAGQRRQPGLQDRCGPARDGCSCSTWHVGIRRRPTCRTADRPGQWCDAQRPRVRLRGPGRIRPRRLPRLARAR